MNNEFFNNNVNDVNMNNNVNTNDSNNTVKKSGKGKTIFLVLLLSLLISGGVFAGLFYAKIITIGTPTSCPSVDNNQQKCDVNQDGNKEESKEYYFKNGNIIGDEQTKNNYELTQGIYDYGMWVEGFTGYQKTVTISIRNTNDIKTKFSLDDSYNIQSKYTLTFTKNVVDILADFATNGIGSSGVFFFLMEDGTVEYFPIYKAFSEKNIKSFGAIKDVENVIKLYSASKEPKEGEYGGNYAILALNKEGKLYDLSKILIDNNVVD